MPAAKLMAVLGVCRRRGRWEISSRTNALVLFGHCFVDFRQAYTDPEVEKIKMSVTCVFGNTTFLMPHGADVKPSAMSLFASTGFEVPESATECQLPTIEMETTTLFGRTRVVIDEEDIVQNPAGADTGLVVDVGSSRAAEVEAVPAEAEAPPGSMSPVIEDHGSEAPSEPPPVPAATPVIDPADDAPIEDLFDALSHVDEPRSPIADEDAGGDSEEGLEAEAAESTLDEQSSDELDEQSDAVKSDDDDVEVHAAPEDGDASAETAPDSIPDAA
ncbi:MAG: hypothetical protein ACR2P0_19655 [Acidimicrobiales bacterium]